MDAHNASIEISEISTAHSVRFVYAWLILNLNERDVIAVVLFIFSQFLLSILIESDMGWKFKSYNLLLIISY